MNDKLQNTYGEILRSSSIIGGAQGINLLIGILRTKFVAVLIGPVGIGLIGTYQAITSLVSTLSGLGIQSSALRNISSAVAAGDDVALGQTALTLRRVALLAGSFGGLLLSALSAPLSQYTFGSNEHALEIALLGMTIFLGHLAGGQTALVQGMRRIGDLARLNVLSSAAGTFIALIFYSILGLRGIAPALVAMAAFNAIFAWYFARRIEFPTVQMTWSESIRAAGGVVRLGLAFMWSSLLVAAVGYMTRALITREVSLEAVGIFAAAFALSGMFVNFVLQAMGADYFPRLTAVANDRQKLNRMVNEQTEVGLLLAIPGLVLTLSLAPWIMRVFYTSEFLPAADLLQWFVLGCLGRVVSWPMGFIMLALGKGTWFAATQSLFHGIHLIMIWIGLVYFGIEGVSVAFFLLYVISTGIVYRVAHHLSGFHWSKSAVNLLLVLLPVTGMTFLLGRNLSIWPATIVGLVACFAISIYCLKELTSRVGVQSPLVARLLELPIVRIFRD